ncbi:hypothetical protein LPJGGPFB_02529 [Ensifer adhaerens]|uniref:hypothetical protein n=1 Tax=Ensifer adhaerens TaxID=106592 RepID=UPI001569390B|nr:hypothetical protein [Ensifer adhaerens]NRP19274.1 hypothetical protein [Ensifer adhaerens]
MTYTEDQFLEIAQAHKEWLDRRKTLTERLLMREYRHESSRILAAQGLVRRLQTLSRCIDGVYTLLPPEETEPQRSSIDEAAIYLQAFVINVYGSLDNLARLWVREYGLTKPGGGAVPQQHIGLGAGCKLVRGSLSQPLQDHLVAADGWFRYLENYRHALAHRIPLYIPPKTLNETEADDHERLEQQAYAALKAGDFDTFDEFMGAQSQLGSFQPMMMHSYGGADGDGWPVAFHGQIICDFATVVRIGEMMVAELDTLP